MWDIKRNEMVNIIIKEVRQACHKQGVTQGAIGVGVVLERRNPFIIGWSEMPEHATLELSIAPIDAYGSTLCYDEQGQITEDGAGTVAMKITGLRRLMKLYDEDYTVLYSPEQYTSGALPDEKLITGLSNQKGAVVIQVGMLVGGFCAYQGAPALTFYIAVSGGTPDQNEAAAWSPLDYIKSEVENERELMLARAFYD